MWSYVDLSGVRTDLTSTTDSSTGVSIIQVYTTLPGYYTCEVSQYGGMSITRYTVGLLNINSYTGTYISLFSLCIRGIESGSVLVSPLWAG